MNCCTTASLLLLLSLVVFCLNFFDNNCIIIPFTSSSSLLVSFVFKQSRRFIRSCSSTSYHQQLRTICVRQHQKRLSSSVNSITSNSVFSFVSAFELPHTPHTPHTPPINTILRRNVATAATVTIRNHSILSRAYINNGNDNNKLNTMTTTRRRSSRLQQQDDPVASNEETTSANTAAPEAGSTKERRTTKKKVDESEPETSVISSKSATKKQKRSKTTDVATTLSDDDNSVTNSAVGSSSEKKRQTKTVAKKKATTTKNTKSDEATSDSETSVAKKKTATKKKKAPAAAAARKKAPNHQVITEREELPKLWPTTDDSSSYRFKVLSWNVAGLRGVLKKQPTVLQDLVQKHAYPDVVCLQETKLQESHVHDVKLNLQETIGIQHLYDSYWSCSTSKKGYSGTVTFVRKQKAADIVSKGSSSSSSKKQQSTLDGFVSTKKSGKKADDSDKTSGMKTTDEVGKKDDSDIASQSKTSTSGDDGSSKILHIDPALLVPTSTSTKMGDAEKHNTEGRVVCVDFPLFSIVNVYVPNAGQKLERLDYRTKEWDVDFVAYIQQKRAPVLWCGDLNIAHTSTEVWNDGAKHLAKQAGVTEQERTSFTNQLETTGYKDAFKHLHPNATGQYSYWSTRAGNRPVNKGLRLDYFICDPSFFAEEASPKSKVLVRDSYMDYDTYGSDHCPVVLEFEIKS